MSKPHRAKQPAQRIPTTEKLATALEQANAPLWLIQNARKGLYDDYKSENPTPIVALVNDCKSCNLESIIDRAIMGEFDAQTWEAEEWRNSPDGQAAFKQFGKHFS